MLDVAASFSATDYLGALDYLRRMSRRVVASWSDIDVLLTPTVSRPPLPIDGLAPQEGEPPIQRLMNAAAWVPFTPVWNVTGQPAISLPLHHTPEGVPVGVQLVGPPAGDELLLALSSQVEAAHPWHERRPEPAVA
jgi:amidase